MLSASSFTCAGRDHCYFASEESYRRSNSKIAVFRRKIIKKIVFNLIYHKLTRDAFKSFYRSQHCILLGILAMSR